MKTLSLILVFFSIELVNAQTSLAESEMTKINGTWIIENEVENKWTFTNNNYCEWLLNGEIIGRFTYSISSEFAPNGVEHTYLKLINISNTNEVYEYALNSIGNTKMTLTSLTPKVSYTHFVKE